MSDKDNYTIINTAPLSFALKKMNELEKDLTLFVVNQEAEVIGTLTDGDARRGLLNNLTLDTRVSNFMNRSFAFLTINRIDISVLLEAKKKGINVLPILNDDNTLNRLINFSSFRSFLPVDAAIMAGGEGIRLRPLTETTPKPLLQIGDKPILEHVIDRLISFGIYNIQISINYLGEQIEFYFNDGSGKDINISYIHESEKLGTIGALRNANEFYNDDVLVMNSDILTNIDFEDFYFDFKNNDSDISIATIPYPVSIPYAILETENGRVTSLKEKPTFEYISNAGIYLIKKRHLKGIPKGCYNATDLIEDLISKGSKVTYYTLYDYWLDIGKMEDYHKAQRDIKHIRL